MPENKTQIDLKAISACVCLQDIEIQSFIFCAISFKSLSDRLKQTVKTDQTAPIETRIKKFCTVSQLTILFVSCTTL